MSRSSTYPSATLNAAQAGGGASTNGASVPVEEAVAHRSGAKRADDIVQLVYVSRSFGGLDQFAVQQIIATSRRHNWRSGVTGCLLFTGTGFVQALEGRTAAVHKLFDRISDDKRHVEIRIALQDRISKRAFPDWAMGCIFDPRLGSDIDAILRTTAISPVMVEKIVNLMVADSFLGTR